MASHHSDLKGGVETSSTSHALSLAPASSTLAEMGASNLVLQDHCHYHGQVRGFPGSWAVLSTCSEMR